MPRPLTPRPRVRTRILVIDEKGVMRDGLCALLGSTEAFEVVGSASTPAEALHIAPSTQPDVIVADFPQLPGNTESIKSLKARFPGACVVVLTFCRDEQAIDGSLAAGADGYVLKSDSCNELFAALRSVAAGKGFLSTSLGGRVMGRFVGSRKSMSALDSVPELTDREREVIRLIAAGRRTREIAQLLSLSHKTVEKHRTSLMRKLGLRNASAVAAYAIAHGLG